MQALPRAFSLGILLTIGHASVISADPILVTDSRLASAYVQIGGAFPAPDLQRPSAPFAPFVVAASASVVEGVASAQTVTTQRSSLGPRLFNASGTVDSSATGAGELFGPAIAAGSSLFEVEFDLPSPHRFLMTSFIAVDRIEESGGFGEVDLVLANRSLTGDIVVVGDGLRFGSRQLRVTGMLPTGRHRLYAEAFAESASSGIFSRHTPRFDLELQLTPVPEPGSLFLIGGGLLALACKRLLAR